MSAAGPAGATRARRLWAGVLCVLLSVTTAGATNAESSSMTATVTATVVVAAIRVDLAIPATQLRVGDKTKATATVTNLGSTRLPQVTVELRAGGGGLAVRGSPSATLSRLQPGKTGSASWSLCAVAPGNYVVLATASVAGVAVDSEARVITVSPGARRKSCT